MGDARSSESWYDQVVEEQDYQWDSDVVVEDERTEEDMEISASPTSAAPMPPRETPIVQGSEAGDDHPGGQNINDSNDENPPWDSDINEDELLGAIADVSIPGRHLDDSVALAIPPDEEIL